MNDTEAIPIVGSGLAGAMLACLLGQAGRRVILFERRGDPRSAANAAGRSINLALSTRGMYALEQVGLLQEVLRQGVIMRGRMIHHRNGSLDYQPYGTDDTQVLHSVSRAELNRALIEKAARLPNVEMRFEHRCTGVHLETGAIEFTTPQGCVTYTGSLIIGADGAYSAVRASMQRRERFNFSQAYLDHGYKELHFPPGSTLQPHALHIWPRGGFMMIALPNADGSFTGTLFWPYTLFDQIQTAQQVVTFFREQFPDAVPLLPTLTQDYATNPIGSLVTIRCAPWHVGRAVLVGDASHAVVPFLGQGMNAAFEDCTTLVEELLAHPDQPERAFAAYDARRRADCDVLAQLCLDNFHEMRDHVGSRWFVWSKRLSLWLMRLLPGYVPLYTLVEFTRVPYAQAQRRVRRQQRWIIAWLSGLLALLGAIVGWWLVVG
ncbi:MAG: NAD(P)/FAD-dependent oxidoreductase [Gemmataceae bacterium]